MTDRPTKSHEYIFLLSKSQRYYYDADAIKEPVTGNAHARGTGVNPKAKSIEANGDELRPRQNESFSAAVSGLVESRNKRSVWTVPTKPVKEAHFATFPPKLIEPCILAGCPEGGTVLDPFSGSGTTAKMCKQLGRKFVGAELNEAYIEIARKRIGCQEVLF